MPEPPESVIITFDFMADLTRLSREDQRRVLRALALLDADEHALSLRVHKLTGERAGQWSASASRSLRIIFERLGEGRKLLLECDHHYGD
jgi:mRNA-degrading endonuclease YafQ of YafQ-DinJ toxin-antitoxin module